MEAIDRQKRRELIERFDELIAEAEVEATKALEVLETLRSVRRGLGRKPKAVTS